MCVYVLLLLCVSPVQAGTKTIGVLVYDGVLTSDVTAPLEIFGVASKLSWFSTEEGLKLGVDTSIDQVGKLDVLIVPSRYAMESLLSNQPLISFIRSQAKQVGWMSSNCSGALLLAEAGVLDGKKATTWAGGEADFQNRYPKVNVQHDQNLVIDSNILTSNGSVVSYHAALTLLKQMSSTSKAQEVADALQFSRISTLTL
ncbi:MAG: transcriptional regulator GlxA family with amidase domain [Candidatus Endobugula sp.]|jgi:transcriptional regulator GlxA family with amidase domain